MLQATVVSLHRLMQGLAAVPPREAKTLMWKATLSDDAAASVCVESLHADAEDGPVLERDSTPCAGEQLGAGDGIEGARSAIDVLALW